MDRASDVAMPTTRRTSLRVDAFRAAVREAKRKKKICPYIVVGVKNKRNLIPPHVTLVQLRSIRTSRVRFNARHASLF